MKLRKMTFITVALFVLSVSTFGQSDLMQKFSLFYEYQRNNDFLSALPYGWQVVNEDPTPFIKYRIFSKMDNILFALHDSSDTSEEDKVMYADSAISLFNKAIKYEPEKAAYYTARKAFVMEVWQKLPAKEVVPVYEDAVFTDPDLDPYYQDRLGNLYLELSNEGDATARDLGLTLYLKLSQKYPDDDHYNQMMSKFASSKEDLAHILKGVWEKDKENAERAWTYTSACLSAELYNDAKEPLVFLTEKYPDVINYWKQLANVYQKLDERDNAINAYKKLIQLQPDNRDNYINVAIIYKKLDQLSVSRSYLQKASAASSGWDYPVFIEAQLYEQSVSNCVSGQLDFMDKVVYKLAYDTYLKAAKMKGDYSSQAADRVKALQNTIPSQEDYFFRNLKSGMEITIEGKCYDWIGRKVIVP